MLTAQFDKKEYCAVAAHYTITLLPVQCKEQLLSVIHCPGWAGLALCSSVHRDCVNTGLVTHYTHHYFYPTSTFQRPEYFVPVVNLHNH